jgi:hypothetical protein
MGMAVTNRPTLPAQRRILRQDEARLLAHRIVRALSAPYAVDGHEVHIGATIGIALAPRDGVKLDHLAACADAALYQAKHKGRGSVVVANESPVPSGWNLIYGSAAHRKRNLRTDIGPHKSIRPRVWSSRSASRALASRDLLRNSRGGLMPSPHATLRYFSSPNDTDSAFHPIIMQLGRAAGLQRHDAPSINLDRLRAVLQPSPGRETDIQLPGDLLSIPTADCFAPLTMSPKVKRHKTFEALTFAGLILVLASCWT